MGVLAAVIWSVLYDLIDPYIFVPAMALGWFARSIRVVLVGAALIAAVSIVLSLTKPLPAGAERVLWLEPIGIIAPLAWSYAVFRLRRWLLQSDRIAPGGPAVRLVRTALGFVLGGCVGCGAGLGLGLLYVSAANVSNFEGGAGYLVVFLFVPLGILIGMIAGAVLAWRRSRRIAPAAA